MTAITQARKDYLGHLVSVYINYRLSITHDAGWHGSNQVGRWMEMGIQPPPKHVSIDSNSKAIEEIKYIRKEHEKLKDAWAIVESLRKKRQLWYEAIIQKHRYPDGTIYFGPNDVWSDGRPYTDEIRAALIGQTEDQFKGNLKQAYRYLDDRLQTIEERNKLVS